MQTRFLRKVVFHKILWSQTCQIFSQPLKKYIVTDDQIAPACTRHQTFTLIESMKIGVERRRVFDSTKRVPKGTSKQHVSRYLMTEILKNFSFEPN